jgi:lysophospholipase L1-like esterase
MSFGPLTYAANRAMLAPRARVPGTLRVAVVGDGLAYGAGLPYRRSLAARLAIHLNGALPAIWTEALPFAVPGACATHAIGRAVAQALPAEPDILLLCIGAHDAPLLGPESERAEDLAGDWKEFHTLLHRALCDFRDAVAATPTRALVVYYDWMRMSREVCLPDLLAQMCEEIGIAFLDASTALQPHAEAELRVSPTDRHLNALGTDVAARLLAHQLVTVGWTPASSDFSSRAWLDEIGRIAQARIDAGLSPTSACADALSVLEAKWMDRRNTGRKEFEPAYAALRQRLLEQHQGSVRRMVLSACGHDLRDKTPASHLLPAEQGANDAMAIAWALQLAADGNTSIISSLTHLVERGPLKTQVIKDVHQRWRDLRAAATALLAIVEPNGAAPGDAAHDSPDLQYFLFWTNRVAQWARIAEQCASRYVDLLARLDNNADGRLRRLIGYTDTLRGSIKEAVDYFRVAFKPLDRMRTLAPQLAGSGSLMLELSASAPPGPGNWTFTVGVDSEVPAYTERLIASGQLVRDNKTHVFEIDLPFMLEGTIYVRFSGLGLSALRLQSAVIKWPQRSLPPLTLARPRTESTAPDAISLVYAEVQTLVPRGVS